MINEASIKCFMALCETLSFTEAARQLFMTQQSVSKYIAKLEEDLGFQLFQRTHHYVAMTRAGENFYALFSDMERQFQETMEQTGPITTALATPCTLAIWSGWISPLASERPCGR